MVIKHSKKLLIASSIVLVVILSVLLILFLFVLANRSVEVYSDVTKSALEEGKCDDIALNDLETVVRSNINLSASIEKAKMEDVLANCYVFRENYIKAVELNNIAAETYTELGDETAAQSRKEIAEIISNLDKQPNLDLEVIEAEKNNPVPEGFQAN